MFDLDPLVILELERELGDVSRGLAYLGANQIPSQVILSRHTTFNDPKAGQMHICGM